MALLSNNKEKNERAERSLTSSSAEKQSDFESEKISEASTELEKGVSQLVEGKEGQEAAEFSDGNIAESEGKGKQTLGSSYTSSSSATQAATKAIIIPTVEIMQKQVAVEIHKQIDKLEKQAHKIASQANFSPFELNTVISRIRRLKDMLANLAYVTAETLKTWWFEFVKGITV